MRSVKERRIFLLSLAAAVLAAAGASAVSLSNPSFESGTLNGGSAHGDVDQISNWAMWNSGDENGDYYATSENTGYAVHSGSRAWRQWDNEEWALYQDVGGIVGGGWYDVSVWVFSGNLASGDTFGNDGGTDRDAGIRLIWDDDGAFWAGSYVDMGVVAAFDPNVDPAAQWVQLAASVQAPAGMNYLRFELRFDENVSWFDGSLSFDDAYLGDHAIPEPSTAALVLFALAAVRFFRGRRRA